jgi:hypothetical protein
MLMSRFWVKSPDLDLIKQVEQVGAEKIGALPPPIGDLLHMVAPRG